MKGVDTSLFRLQHDNPDLFHRSEWDLPGGPSLGYCCYRACLALAMVTGIALHFASTLDTLGGKEQGICLLTVHYILYAGLVWGVRWRGDATPSTAPSSLPALYSFSWGLQTAFTTVALWITIVYWTALHPYVVEFNLIEGLWLNLLNVFLHAVNTASCLLDMCLTARPVRIQHAYLPALFGLWYTAFSLVGSLATLRYDCWLQVYWAAGGTGRCGPRPDLPDQPQHYCDKYIYPILDWEDHPAAAAGVVVGGCLVMPLLQAAWWGLAWIRQKIHTSIYPSTTQ